MGRRRMVRHDERRRPAQLGSRWTLIAPAVCNGACNNLQRIPPVMRVDRDLPGSVGSGVNSRRLEGADARNPGGLNVRSALLWALPSRWASRVCPAVLSLDKWLAERLAFCELVHKRFILLGNLEAPPGIEPGMEVLQTSALPLGDGAHRRDPQNSGTPPFSRRDPLAPRKSCTAEEHRASGRREARVRGWDRLTDSGSPHRAERPKNLVCGKPIRERIRMGVARHAPIGEASVHREQVQAPHPFVRARLLHATVQVLEGITVPWRPSSSVAGNRTAPAGTPASRAREKNSWSCP